MTGNTSAVRRLIILGKPSTKSEGDACRPADWEEIQYSLGFSGRKTNLPCLPTRVKGFA